MSFVYIRRLRSIRTIVVLAKCDVCSGEVLARLMYVVSKVMYAPPAVVNLIYITTVMGNMMYMVAHVARVMYIAMVRA